MGLQASPITSLVIVAHEQGFFKDNGLQIQIKYYQSGKLAMKGMFRNEVDISTAADMPVMSHSLTRNDFQIISSIATTENGAWIVARKDRNITTPGDLKGKIIATQENSAVHFFLRLFLLQNSINENDVTLKYMTPSELPAALIKGEIDAFSMRNPFIDEVKKQMPGKVIEFMEPNIYTQFFNLIASKQFIATNTSEIIKILDALLKAEAYLDRHPGKAQSIVAEQLDIPLSSLEKEWPVYSFNVSLQQSMLLTLEDQARWILGKQVGEKKSIPNYLNYIHVDCLNTIAPDTMQIYIQPENKIIVSENGQVVVTPIYIADKNGYFTKRGLDVELKRYQTGNACLKAVLAKEADIGVVAEIPFMKACINQQPVLILANLVKTNDYSALIVDKDRGIQMPGDLTNKTIGVVKGTGGEFYLDLILLFNNINKSEINIIHQKPSEMVMNIQNNVVDGVYIWNPHLLNIKKSLGDRAVMFHNEEGYSPVFSLVVHQENLHLQKRPENIEKFMGAIREAELFIKKNPGKTITILAKEIDMTPGILNELWDNYIFDMSLDPSYILLLRDAARWAIENNQVESRNSPNFQDFLQPYFLNKIKPGSVTLDKPGG